MNAGEGGPLGIGLTPTRAESQSPTMRLVRRTGRTNAARAAYLLGHADG